MTAYRVEIGSPACPHCDTGATWDVIGPDGIATGTSYDDEPDADEMAAALNHAYELGREQPLDVLRAINRALLIGIDPREVLDENSPIRDAIRDAIRSQP